MRNNGDEIEFRKSTFSGASECVEVAFVDNGTRQVMVRDSKHRNGAVLQFTHSEWGAFVRGVRARANSDNNTVPLRPKGIGIALAPRRSDLRGAKVSARAS